MSYIILRGHSCDVIVPNAQAPTEDETGIQKYSSYDVPERVFDKFLHTTLLGDFNANVKREDILKPLSALSLWLKRPDREADNSLPCSAEVKE
jgi:hypothetical protein